MLKSKLIALFSIFVLESIVKMTTNVAIAHREFKPRYNASFGAIGKLLGKQNVTRKNVEDGPAIFNALKM